MTNLLPATMSVNGLSALLCRGKNSSLVSAFFFFFFFFFFFDWGEGVAAHFIVLLLAAYVPMTLDVLDSKDAMDRDPTDRYIYANATDGRGSRQPGSPASIPLSGQSGSPPLHHTPRLMHPSIPRPVISLTPDYATRARKFRGR